MQVDPVSTIQPAMTIGSLVALPVLFSMLVFDNRHRLFKDKDFDQKFKSLYDKSKEKSSASLSMTLLYFTRRFIYAIALTWVSFPCL